MNGMEEKRIWEMLFCLDQNDISEAGRLFCVRFERDDPLISAPLREMMWICVVSKSISGAELDKSCKCRCGFAVVV